MTDLVRARLRRGGGLLAALVAVVALVLIAGGGAARAADLKFPTLTGRVVDEAHMLTPQAAQKLDGELADLETKTGHQLVVATVPSLQGHEIEEYGYQLGRHWQLGRKGVNDGAILLVAPAEHKVRIEVGYGLEPVLTDALTSVILQTKVLPQFKQGHMEQGLIDGAEALVSQLSLPDDQAKANVAQAAARPAVAHDNGGVRPHIPVFFILLIVFWVITGILRGAGRRGGLGGMWWLPFLFMGGGRGGGGGWGGGGGGGFSGGGGSFGGGGSSGSW